MAKKTQPRKAGAARPEPRHIPGLPIKIGVMGSAGGTDAGADDLAFRLGQEIARHGCHLVTGACPGLPHQAVKGAKAEGGLVIGISPGLNLEEHIIKYHSPYQGYDALIFTGSGLMGREIENIRTCDIVVFIGGRSGSLGEFAIAYDESKIIGGLQGAGGISDQIDTILAAIKKETAAVIVTSRDPAILTEELLQTYQSHLRPHYETLLANAPPDGTLDD